MTEPEASAEPAPLNPYDEVPYRGQTVPLAHPERLAIEALRRGIAAAPPGRARILELGCAEGGNVIPIAFHLDGAEVVGVDGSAVQIATAAEVRDRLGLDNLTLRHADFLGLGEELGTFDYILCHGVYSWVAEPVRDKIMAIAQRHLRPNGVLYLSYNCRPGWAFRSLMRRALTERVRGAADAAERIARVRQVIAWMAESPLRESPWGRLLAEEAAALWSHRDEYLVHEYLSAVNRPFHFREIADAADRHELSFLAELARATTDPRLEDALRQSFSGPLDDWVEIEELSELFLFRAFRCTLFTKRSAERGAPHPDLAAAVRFAGRIEPESRRVSLEAGVHEFFTVGGVRISAEDPILKGALLEIGRWWPRGLTFAELAERVAALLEVRRVHPPGEAPEAARYEALRTDLYELGRLGYVTLRLDDPPVAREPGEAPRVSPLTRLQAERGHFATSPHHRVAPLDAFTRHLVRHLDGARERDELAKRMRAHAEAGEVSLTLEDGTPLGPAELDEAIPKLVEASLGALASEGLLVDVAR